MVCGGSYGKLHFLVGYRTLRCAVKGTRKLPATPAYVV